MQSVPTVPRTDNSSGSLCLNCLYKPFGLFIYLIDLYRSIIASQYCVSFCCTTKRISHMHTHVPISPASWASLLSSLSHPSRSSQSGSPCAMLLLPTSQLFYIPLCICVDATLTLVYTEHLLSFWESRTWYVPGRGCLPTSPLEKLWVRSLQWTSLVGNISYTSQLLAREWCPLWLHWEGFLEACAWFPRLCPMCLFPLLVLLCIILP